MSCPYSCASIMMDSHSYGGRAVPDENYLPAGTAFGAGSF